MRRLHLTRYCASFSDSSLSVRQVVADIINHLRFDVPLLFPPALPSPSLSCRHILLLFSIHAIHSFMFVAALFAVLFGDSLEESFSCYRLLQAVGLSVAFGYSHFLCVATKVYVMAALLAVALLFYTVVETRLQRHKKYIDSVVVL